MQQGSDRSCGEAVLELIEGGTAGIVRRGTGAVERLLQHHDVAPLQVVPA